MRPDVIEAAAQSSDIIFPIFTNGTMIDEKIIGLLEQNRNLLPVFSLEGEASETDARRGEGVYHTVMSEMAALGAKGILFGASITVTRKNRKEVTQPDFIRALGKMGCRLVFFVEYVPLGGDEDLALSPGNIDEFSRDVSSLKEKEKGMILLSFPGDEAAMGGCLASGRGFFHINPVGNAEPCPFSPYAKDNLKSTSLLTVLKSDYFERLRQLAGEEEEHSGGCTLFRLEDEVKAVGKALSEKGRIG